MEFLADLHQLGRGGPKARGNMSPRGPTAWLLPFLGIIPMLTTSISQRGQRVKLRPLGNMCPEVLI